MGNNREIVNVCLITESRHGGRWTYRGDGCSVVPLFDAGANICSYVAFFSLFFSPLLFFYACNIGGHRGSANANFHPFIPVTHNPLKRRERGEGRGGYELIGSRRKHR